MKFIGWTLLCCFWIHHVSEAQTDRTNIARILAQLKDGEASSNDPISPEREYDIQKIDNDKKKVIVKYYEMNNRRRRKNKDLLIRSSRVCFTDRDCGTETGHVCAKNKCRCHPNYVRHNSTHCLPGTLLGFSCLTHSQCSIRVPHSSCIQGFCRCGAGSVPYRRANCLKGSFLGESCRTNSQCLLGVAGSHCKWIVKNVWGQCQCEPDLPRRGDKCGPRGFALGAPCGKSLDCAQHVPGAICVGLVELPENATQAALDLAPSRGATTNRIWRQNRQIEEEEPSLGGVCQCPEGYLAIKNNTRCVPVKKEIGISPVSLGKPCLFSSQCKASDPYTFCNEGVCDCLVKSSQCSPTNTGCEKETFQCISDGRCISANFVCDGKHQCNDGSDEVDCVSGRCNHLAFVCDDGSCVGRGKICDGKTDCPDGSDEARCIAKRKECPATTFRCNDGQCLPGFTFCNSFVSCKDKSDEDIKTCIGGVFRVPYCPFRCKNGRCRSTAILCSGKDGCGDASDEENCAVCSCPQPTGKENKLRNFINK